MLPWKRALGPLSALALAVTAAVVPAATTAQAASAPSSGWNNYSCKPSAAHPRPVVLVPGTLGNATDNFLALAPYLVDRGYCVFSSTTGNSRARPSSTGSARSTSRPNSSPASSTRCSRRPVRRRPTSSATRRAA